MLNGAMPSRRGPYPSVQACRPGDCPWLQGQWETDQRIAMDARFVEAMVKAGYSVTAPSTHFGHAGTASGILRFGPHD